MLALNQESGQVGTEREEEGRSGAGGGGGTGDVFEGL